MNHTLKKGLSIVLALALLLGAGGAYWLTSGKASAANASATSDADASASQGDVQEDAAETKRPVTDPNAEPSKEETVYVVAGSDGSVEKVIVSDWLKNEGGDDTIKDESDLTDIENTSGDESFSMDPNNLKVWQADGNDIHYQGVTDKELPVAVSVSYKLDGKTVTPDELAGKSGHVTIRFDYYNTAKQTVELDGKDTEMYVPFVMMTGLVLDDSFTNVEVSNGKVYSDGDRTMVAGFALPGLREDLNLSEDQADLPEYLEVEADTTDFSLTTTATMAVSDVFGQLSLDQSQDAEDQLDDAISQLTSGMTQLTDGSSSLYDGMQTLLDKSNDLVAGIDQLVAGAKSLSDGTQTLSSGASDVADGAAKVSDGANSVEKGASDVASGAGSLSQGLGKLDSNSKTLTDGSAEVFANLLKAANTQLKNSGLDVQELTADNYKTVLTEVIASVKATDPTSTAQKTVEAAVRAKTDTIRQGVALNMVLTQQGLTQDQFTALQTAAAGGDPTALATVGAIQTAVAGVLTSTDATVKGTLDAYTEQTVQSLIAQNMQSTDVQSQIAAGQKKVDTAVDSLTTLLEQLEGYETFNSGLKDYTAGVGSAYTGSQTLTTGATQLKDGAASLADGASQLKDGAYTLKDGAIALNDGAQKLYQGLLTLQSGSGALVDGVKKLTNGAMQLSDGIKKFCGSQGLGKLTDALSGDVMGTVNRVRAISDLSRTYTNFSGITDGMSGSVKFVYRTDSIG